MTTKRQREQIKRLAKQCRSAYQADPTLWLSRDGEVVFDFPDYGGLPKRTANCLSSDCVDVIQGFLVDVSYGSKRFTQRNLERVLLDYANIGYALPY